MKTAGILPFLLLLMHTDCATNCQSEWLSSPPCHAIFSQLRCSLPCISCKPAAAIVLFSCSSGQHVLFVVGGSRWKDLLLSNRRLLNINEWHTVSRFKITNISLTYFYNKYCQSHARMKVKTKVISFFYKVGYFHIFVITYFNII